MEGPQVHKALEGLGIVKKKGTLKYLQPRFQPSRLNLVKDF